MTKNRSRVEPSDRLLRRIQLCPESRFLKDYMCWLEENPGPDSKDLFAAYPSFFQRLTSLHIFRLKDHAVKSLIACLPGSQITTLYLSHNRIGNEGALALAEVLPKSRLKKVYLQKNDIWDEVQQTLKEVAQCHGIEIFL